MSLNQDERNPDMTNAQYHAQLDRLWSVVPAHDKGDNVFDLVVTRIAALEAERDELRKTVDKANLDMVKAMEEISKLRKLLEQLLSDVMNFGSSSVKDRSAARAAREYLGDE